MNVPKMTFRPKPEFFTEPEGKAWPDETGTQYDTDAMSTSSSHQIRNLEAMSPDEKWQMICDEPTITTLHDPIFYIRQLRAHMNPTINTLKKTPKKKLIKDLVPIRQVLEDLKEDTNPYNIDFIKDFISGSKEGVDVLMRFIRDTQNHIIERTKLLATDPNKVDTLQRKEQSKSHYLTVKRELVDESDCLYCLRNIADTEEGLTELLRKPEVLETVAYCVISKALPSRLNSLRVLTLACATWEGHDRVLEVMSFLKVKIKEKVRFHALSQMLTVERGRFELVTTILQFLNALLSTTTNLNRRVYLQYELELAQFDPIALEKSYGVNLPPTVKTELDTWHNRYISIQALQDDLVSIKDRNQLLRQEVDIQQDKLREVEDKKILLEKDLGDGTKKADEYRERIVELQDTVENLTKNYQDKTGEKPEQVVRSFDHVMRPLDLESVASSVEHLNSIGESESVTPESSETASVVYDTPATPVHPVATTSKSPERKVRANIPAAPPMPVPAAPPLPHRSGSRNKRRHVSKAPMPMLNWTPLRHPGNTVFKILNEDTIYKELDLGDFENTFKLRQQQSSTETIERMKRFQERAAEEIHVIEQNRAKNMVIAHRRIGLEIEKITEAINRCDTNVVPGEYAELLLKFLPTKEELKGLAQHTDQYDKLGEAERMMFQMARVDRYESKLRLMAFMGIYDELVEALIPDIESVLKASDALIKNKKIKKIFEIILAFGNYMNSSKRGAASGFKLNSLDKLTFVKSHDRSHTFLNYLVETVRRCYPELQGWYDELHLEHVRNVSLESMTLDINGLRKGLELAKSERDRQQNNTIIERFYSIAADTVHSLSDRFKKMEETYHQVCAMYGENYKDVEPVDFFKYFRDFGYQYKRAAKDNLEKPISANPRRKSLITAETSPGSPKTKKSSSKRWTTKASIFGGNSKHTEEFSPRSPSKLSSAASSDSGVFVTTSPELESEYDSIPYSRSNGITNNNESKPKLVKNRKLLNQNNSNNSNSSDSGSNVELCSRTYGRLEDDDGTPALPWASVVSQSGVSVSKLREKYRSTPPMNRKTVTTKF
ncbi:formin-like protein 3 isoform X2 [Amphiura filiformis]|uniref:formin-like protein 3 isoform X2 n=1 Tax=Amphiura filiformis TaxID=82378 RepID=UPI003B21AFD6